MDAAEAMHRVIYNMRMQIDMLDADRARVEREDMPAEQRAEILSLMDENRAIAVANIANAERRLLAT